ncbi:hypothetical protein BK025_00050 [Sodalis sp. TME1]|nr:hypothetical protein BK025_00050 [Sodalis sp. TME1]
MTRDEKRHLSRVASLGCIACRRVGLGATPAEIHHIRDGQGAGLRASHYETIPLYPPHHRTGGHGVAIHAGRKVWEENYGAEQELLRQIRAELEMLYEH